MMKGSETSVETKTEKSFETKAVAAKTSQKRNVEPVNNPHYLRLNQTCSESHF
jgi:hypothetical protein